MGWIKALISLPTIFKTVMAAKEILSKIGPFIKEIREVGVKAKALVVKFKTAKADGKLDDREIDSLFAALGELLDEADDVLKLFCKDIAATSDRLGEMPRI